MNSEGHGYAARDLVYVPLCDVCGHDAFDLVFEKEGFRHVRCTSCGLVFVNPRLKAHAQGQTISGTGAMTEDVITSNQARRLRKEARLFDPYRSLNTLLEIGPGKGWFLMEAGALGWETHAVEINELCVRRLRVQGIKRIHEGGVHTWSPTLHSFDVIRMWDVIEHLESPSLALEKCALALRPGGLLTMATTNFASLSRIVNGPEWVYLNGCDHIVLFSPVTIARLLYKHGFIRVNIRTRSFNLRRKLYFPPRDLPPGPRVLRPFRKIVDTLIGWTSYGHQMIVTAEKPLPKTG